jgi:hypothetical protein
MDLEVGLPASDDSRDSRDRSLERLDILERKLELEQRKKSLLCCSGSVGKDALEYGVQVGFSVIIMTFAMHNLLHTEKFHDISVSIISMLMGIYLPAKKKDEKSGR